jgi:hypothetical protein
MRGRAAASVDAAGAAMGCVGLAGFAVVVWRGLERHNSYAVIGLGAVVLFCRLVCGWLEGAGWCAGLWGGGDSEA